jgi:transcriptional regulator with XRE-family HTH domain
MYLKGKNMLKFSKVSDFFTSEQIVNFGIRIRQIRLAKKIKIVCVCDSLQINPAVMSRIEHGKLIPGTKILSKICLFFSVSPDWILFGNGEQTMLCGKLNLAGMGTRIKELRGSTSKLQLSIMLGTSSSFYLGQIERGEVVPYLGTILKISKIFKVSLSFILFGKYLKNK